MKIRRKKKHLSAEYDLHNKKSFLGEKKKNKDENMEIVTVSKKEQNEEGKKKRRDR